MHRDERPLVAVTMGDAAGIGPEVVVKALAGHKLYEICRPVVIGSSSILQRTLGLPGLRLTIKSLTAPGAASGEPGIIEVLDMKNLDPERVVTGQVSPACAKAAVEYILKAAELALKGDISALVTAPINKEATRLAGYGELGHLEILAGRTGCSEYATMLVSGKLRVVHLTTHYSLKEALDFVTREKILAKLRLIDRSFAPWGLERPRIGVAALNPHGGEGGIVGREEIEEIVPAVASAVKLNIDARGPVPADTIFNQAIQGKFDVVLALYHDQGHIAVKVHGFEKSLSIALGLPFIRTSVAHGTAFDIAGKGIADATSMQEAIKAAVGLIRGELP